MSLMVRAMVVSARWAARSRRLRLERACARAEAGRVAEFDAGILVLEDAVVFRDPAEALPRAANHDLRACRLSRTTMVLALEQRPLWRYHEASTHAPGSARRHLERSSRKLGYLNEAVLPFYVLHSSVIVVTAYFVVQWPIPDPLKAVIIATVAFGAIALLYEGAVRRVRLLRVLFGMKAARHAAGVPREEHLMSSPVRPG